MQRDLAALAERTFDLLVVGGGIHGSIAAWDAALRGLEVALVDRSDFGAATSANSLKIVHGGLRYLQTGDLRRMRESIAERSTLVRIAQHLVRPLPFLVPTRGLGRDSRAALGAALALADAVGFDRNRGLPDGSRFPRGGLVSQRRCLELLPALAGLPSSGGALWYDGQLLDSERLTLAFLQSAAARGACLANHVEVRRLALQGSRVAGALVRDHEGGREFDVRARAVLDARGASAAVALPADGDRALTVPRRGMALAVNLVLRGRLGDVALGLRTRTGAEHDPVCGGRRYVFLVPWRESTLVGTTYRPWTGSPDSLEVTESQLRVLLDECNEVCPSLGLSLERVAAYHRGLVPLKAGSERGRPGALAEETRLLDHGETDGVSGLVSLSGVKYTTARAAAARAVDLVCRRLGRAGVRSATERTPVYGGEDPPSAPRSAAESRLAAVHGSRAAALVRRFEGEPGWSELLPGGAGVLCGEVLLAVRDEMALTLGDVVRRTGLGAGGCPSSEALEAAAALAAGALGWSESRRRREIDAVVDASRPLVGVRVRS
jgi:glycerol-3-phosphate dehydrogenase